jgi:hypothetical protein
MKHAPFCSNPIRHCPLFRVRAGALIAVPRALERVVDLSHQVVCGCVGARGCFDVHGFGI